MHLMFSLLTVTGLIGAMTAATAAICAAIARSERRPKVMPPFKSRNPFRRRSSR